MDAILPSIQTPVDLQELNQTQLKQLASEIRETLCQLLGTRSAHFASNMGVVEICLALHSTFDFSRDRLVWDTGHQIYPHKLVTGRYDQFDTIRTKGGLMGYPNPIESLYDLFVTGHVGSSVGSCLGLQVGDDLLRPNENRHAVAVIGDGAFTSGSVFEALNHGGELKKNFTIVLNDNKMSICPRVGGVGKSLDRIRMTHAYTGFKAEMHKMLRNVPLLGGSTERFLFQFKEALKAGLVGGMMFEEFGFNYLGPIDGHNIAQMQKYLKMARGFDGPVVLHAVTQKGYGFKPAENDPTMYHAPAPFRRENGLAIPNGSPKPKLKPKLKPELELESDSESEPDVNTDSPSNPQPVALPYTQLASDGILAAMRSDPRVCVITAAMCQGNKLEQIRDEFPDRFFDVSICEAHAVVFAAGLAKAGMRPVVDIYSTFLQRAYDQIFQEISLQKDLPITLMLDRGGLSGPDGATHHGVFDLGYLRPFPNLEVITPGDGQDMAAMVQYAIGSGRPVALRYPKCTAARLPRPGHTVSPIQSGCCELLRSGDDGLLLAAGSLVETCLEAADLLQAEGLDVGVINARFVKPLDTDTLLPIIAKSPFTVTIEEGMLAGGFGSSVLEAVNDAGLDSSMIRRLGIGDHYVEHGPREELLADLGLNAPSIADTCRQMHDRAKQRSASHSN